MAAGVATTVIYSIGAVAMLADMLRASPVVFHAPEGWEVLTASAPPERLEELGISLGKLGDPRRNTLAIVELSPEHRVAYEAHWLGQPCLPGTEATAKRRDFQIAELERLGTSPELVGRAEVTLAGVSSDMFEIAYQRDGERHLARMYLVPAGYQCASLALTACEPHFKTYLPAFEQALARTEGIRTPTLPFDATWLLAAGAVVELLVVFGFRQAESSTEQQPGPGPAPYRQAAPREPGRRRERRQRAAVRERDETGDGAER